MGSHWGGGYSSDVDTAARNYTVACSATSTVERGDTAAYGVPRVHSITGKVTPAVFPVWQGGWGSSSSQQLAQQPCLTVAQSAPTPVVRTCECTLMSVWRCLQTCWC